MKNKIKKYITDNKMINHGESVVAGVSGGSDSMCLLNVLMELREELGLTLYAVHVHHGIRGVDADEDMEFVEMYCAEHDVECYTYRFDVINEAKKLNMSTEEAGRHLRYKAFEEVAGRCNGKIAVAHNVEDNVETILLNMCRGTGITGMCGIMPVRDNVIRPIMCLTKQEIYEYLNERNISYRVDKSNFTEEYTRNKIRLKVLPYITEHINTRAVEHIGQLSQNVKEAVEFIDEYVDSVLHKYMRAEKDSVHISVNVQNEKGIIISGVIRRAIKTITNSLKDITNVHIEEAKSILDKQVGTIIYLPYGIRVEKGYDEVKVYKEKGTDKKSASVEKQIEIDIQDYGEYVIENFGKLIVSKSEYTEEIFGKSIYTKWVDCDILKDSLQIRTRQTGDYIVVNEKGSRKKIKDLFIDLKIPREQRDNILLLTKNHEVVWVIGHRLGYNYKVHKNSENVTLLEYVDKNGVNDGRKN